MVDSPIEGPARPVAPIPNPAGPELPMSWLFFDDAPMSWPVTPSAPIVLPVFGVFPILGPAAGALPILAPVFGPVDSFGARMSLSIDSSISRIARASRPEASKSPESRVLVEAADAFERRTQFLQISAGLGDSRDHFVEHDPARGHRMIRYICLGGLEQISDLVSPFLRPAEVPRDRSCSNRGSGDTCSGMSIRRLADSRS